MIKNILNVVVTVLIGLLSASGWRQLAEAGVTKPKPRDVSPVTVVMTYPTNGATVSGTITLTAEASSTAGMIKYVEFYDIYCETNNGIVNCTTNLIGTSTNSAYKVVPAPKNFNVY